ncbi:MAG: hypothetical protein ABIH22_03865 [Candidatus Margulisiibacteriota bacterium]
MAGKATMDLNRRTVGRVGLLWNRLTPTRGAKTVSATLCGLSLSGQAKVTVEKNALLVQSGEKQVKLPSSQYYARCLYKAGVTEIEIPQRTGTREIKLILDALSDKTIKKAKTSFKEHDLSTSIEDGGTNIPIETSPHHSFLEKISAAKAMLPESEHFFTFDYLFELGDEKWSVDHDMLGVISGAIELFLIGGVLGGPVGAFFGLCLMGTPITFLMIGCPKLFFLPLYPVFFAFTTVSAAIERTIKLPFRLMQFIHHYNQIDKLSK